MSQLYVAQVPKMSTAQKIITALIAIGVIVAIIWALSNMKSKKGKKSSKTRGPSISPQLPSDNSVISSDIADIFQSITGVNTTTPDGPIEETNTGTTNPMAWITGNKNAPEPPTTGIPPLDAAKPVVEPEPVKIQPAKPIRAQPIAEPAQPVVTLPVEPTPPANNISLDDLYESDITSSNGIPLLPA